MTPRTAAWHTTDVARCYVVTGADSGLGRAVADRLAGEGRVLTSGLGKAVDVQADLATLHGRRRFVGRLFFRQPSSWQ